MKNIFYILLTIIIYTAVSCSLGDSEFIYNQSSPFRNVTSTHLVSANVSDNTMDGHAVDIDNDGDTDLILAIEFKPNVILINDGTGKLVDESAERFPSTNRDSEDIAIADFDNDGDLDIIFVSEDDEVNEYFENDGNAVFSDKSSKIFFDGISNAVEVFDFNDDGFPDLLIGNRGQNFLLINDGDGSYTDESIPRFGTNDYTTQDVELADIDSDGDPDILEANETFNRILINDGEGFFEDMTSSLLPAVDDQTREVDVADVDSDGDLDIFYANVYYGNIGDPQNRLLLNDGSGKFEEVTTSHLPPSQLISVDADFFDIDDDGDPDLLSGNRYNGMLHMVLINDGNGSFTDQTSGYLPTLNIYPFDFQVADFNNDGTNDIYICVFEGQDLLFFRTK